jgi:signal transduction histidine kinase
MSPEPTDTHAPSGFFGPSSRPDSLDSGALELATPIKVLGPARIGWRRHLLLLVAVMGCMAVFLLARWLANQPHIPAEWRHGARGQLELASSSLPQLAPFLGAELKGIKMPNGQLSAPTSLATSESARWIADDHRRNAQLEARLQAAYALEAGQVTLVFSEGREITLKTHARGYLGLGAMFWLLSAFATILYLVGWIVPLVQPQFRNALYGLMAHAQAAQLLLAAMGSVQGLALPPSLTLADPIIRILLDLITGAAVVHAITIHPRRLPGGGFMAVAVWLLVVAYALVFTQPGAQGSWWVAQGILLCEGALTIGLLHWSYKISPHPFALVMRRFGDVTLITLTLLTLAVAMLPMLPQEVQPAAAAGPVIWGVFFASIVLLIPFIARSQNVMREFAMLAGVSTVATSVDLLFVAAFSFSQFASLTLSLFLALGAYAAIRHWIVQQMMGARTLTTERMFEHLYRIAREVEARPERAGDRMAELLRHVFEPLETVFTHGTDRHSRISGNGAVLLVPMPNLVQGPDTDGMVALRFAERGKRLFTPEDARLADRILEQLMRALAHDRAVERGRSEERTRIAQDLHDDIGARLLTLMYKSPSKEMEDYVRHTLQDLKTLTRGLAAQSHPLSHAAAEWKSDITQRLAAVKCELEWSASYDQDLTLSVVQWSALTRILRELVSNAIAHSKAQHVSIECTLEQGHFSIVMIDDGVGREPKRWSHGLGLGGIRKRVKMLGGSVHWQEREPRGVRCEVLIDSLR